MFYIPQNKVRGWGAGYNKLRHVKVVILFSCKGHFKSTVYICRYYVTM